MKKVLLWFVLTFLVFGLALAVTHRAEAAGTELLPLPWNFTIQNGSSEKYQSVPSNVLTGKQSLTLTYNLAGLCLLGGDASAIIFDQNGWKYASLSNYGQNCYSGQQTVTIPLTAFGVSTTTSLTGSFHARFWKSGGPYAIEITHAVLNDATSTPPTPPANVRPTVTATAMPTSGLTPLTVNFTSTATDTDGSIANYLWKFGTGATSSLASPSFTYLSTGTFTSILTVTDNQGAQASTSLSISVTAPVVIPPATTSTTSTWVVQSVDAMKLTQDALCNTPSTSTINSWMDRAVEVGATHVAISTSYDSAPGCDAQAFSQKWVTLIRAHGLKVWHRHKDRGFEGWWGADKNRSPDGNRHLKTMSDWILSNPSLVQPGDIFTPFPEPQNGGISGVTWCGSPANCQFANAADFNEWLRMAQNTAKLALKATGKNIATTIGDPNGVFVGASGFDGFIVAGVNNPDWQGKTFLESATVAAMDNLIAVDHYTADASRMAPELAIMRGVWPNALFVIGEYGTTDQTTDVARVDAAQKAFTAFKAATYIVGVNYWHLGYGGNEALLNDDNSKRPHFTTVQSFYRP